MELRGLALRTLAFASFTCSTVLAANVWIVAPSGGNFTQIQAAIDAASDGDVVLVKTGSYDTFVVNDKDLSILTDVGNAATVQGAIRVTNLAAGKSVLVAGLSARGISDPSVPLQHGLYVASSPGHVRIQDCTLRGLHWVAGVTPRSGAKIQSSARVSLARCSVSGTDATNASGSIASGVGFEAASSGLALYDSTTAGGDGWQPQCGFNCYAGDGAHAGTLSAAFAFASNTTFYGGHGGNSLGTCPLTGSCNACAEYGDGTFGGNGLLATGSTVNSLACSFLPGAGGAPGCGAGLCGCSCCGAPGGAGQPAVGFTPNTVSGTSRRMLAAHVVRELATWNLTFQGQPGDRVALFLSRLPQFAYNPGLHGMSLVAHAPPNGIAAELGTCDAAGELNTTFEFAELEAGVLAKRWFVQPMFITPTGSRTLGTPNDVVVLDSSL